MNDSEAIAAGHAGFWSAFAVEDIQSMSEYLTEDHIMMPPNQAQLVGREAAQELWREGFSGAKVEAKSRSRDVIVAGDMAVDRFNWAMVITPRDGSPSTEDTGECMWIWRKEGDGRWRLTMSIWNSDLVEPRAP